MEQQAGTRQQTGVSTVKDVMGFLGSPGAIASLKAACSKHVTPERLVRVAGAALSRQPKLLECTRESLFVALQNCGQLGIEPNLLGEAYLVPFRNNTTGKTECQFMPGYRGLVKLARRSGEISTIEAHVVYALDKFEYRLGDDPGIKHEPYIGDDEPGPMRYAYAVAVFKDGGRQREIMTRRQIEAVRSRSKAANAGPWVTDYEEMAKKTVLKRLAKMLPLTIELTEAIEKDIETEIDITPVPVEPGTGIPEPGEEPHTRTDGIRFKIGRPPGSRNRPKDGPQPPPPPPETTGTPGELPVATPVLPAGLTLNITDDELCAAVEQSGVPLVIAERYLSAMSGSPKDTPIDKIPQASRRPVLRDPAGFAKEANAWADREAAKE